MQLLVSLLASTAISSQAFGAEEMSLLQKPVFGVASGKAQTLHKVALRRESSPVRRSGVVVSYKNSYSGVIRVGSPAQEFRMVFDTGSAHVIVPAAACEDGGCVGKTRYSMEDSQTGYAVNVDGSKVPEGEWCDQVDIGFGTGEVKGEFVKERVCLGSNASDGNLCTEMLVVTAVAMSNHPFASFGFDGILGLGLKSLALAPDFNFVNLLSEAQRVQAPQFGVFLTDGDSGVPSELAFGGYDSTRITHEVKWSHVTRSEQGYWQVPILAIRVDGVELDLCKDGTCRGVADTGTSHLGIPAPHDRDISQMLAQDAGDLLDCRLATAPTLQIELDKINITLYPYNYMRRLPLREGVKVGTATVANATSFSNSSNSSNASRYCGARLMPVKLPAPVGPKMFILGEPMLHRYYSVYDWDQLKVGFALANVEQNRPGFSLASRGRGELPDDVERLLMQQRMSVQKGASGEVFDIDNIESSRGTAF